METPKTRTSSSEAPKKTSPRVVRQLKVSSVAFGSSNPASPSGTAARTPKDRSPKVPERKSPRSSLVPEKKRVSRVSELEGQISELHDDLKKVNEQLTASKASKEEAEADAEELKEQLAALTSKFEESQRQLSDLCASREAHVAEFKGVSEEKDRAWEAQLEITRKQHSIDASSLASALDEIETLKKQLEMVSRYEDEDGKSRELSDIEVRGLRENLGETLMILESMKNEMMSCKQSEAQAQDLAHETLIQLEIAKQTVNALRDDGTKAMEAYTSVSLELENSKARIALLEGVVNKLKVDLAESNDNNAFETPHSNQVNELMDLRSEVAELKSALEAADFRRHDEEVQTSAQIKSAHESADEIASESSVKQAELVEELKSAKSAIEELKANLMDKENELQGISEENECLILKLQESKSDHQENKLEDELNRLKGEVASLRANLMDKETELQIITEENATLKSEVASRISGPIVEEAEVAEQEDTLMKLEVMKEEAEKSKRRAARAGEQLEAAQAANGELEAELRRLKVQSDQWRKAAEAAASMLSSSGGNGRFVERTGSLDNNNGYSSPFMDDYDDEDAFKKKNGNVLRKIGGFWKKPQK